jgi:hypothetical protein
MIKYGKHVYQIVSDLRVGWIQAPIGFANLQHEFQQHIDKTTNIFFLRQVPDALFCRQSLATTPLVEGICSPSLAMLGLPCSTLLSKL